MPRAVEEIGRELSDDPSGAGESRSDNERVLVVEPFTVYYEVFEEHGVVLIYQYVFHH